MQHYPIKIIYGLATVSLILLILLSCQVHKVYEQNYKKDIEIYRHFLQKEAEKLGDDFNLLAGYGEMLANNSLLLNSLQQYFRQPTLPQTNTSLISNVLDQLADIDHILAASVMDCSGRCLYSSRADLVGQNYHFRPYFKDALLNGRSIYMATGVTSQEIGIYYTRHIKENNRVLGVIVIKVELSFFDITPLPMLAEKQLAEGDVFMGIATSEGIFYNTINKNLLSIDPLSVRLSKELQKSRQFPLDQVGLLNFPTGTWQELMTKGYLKQHQKKDNRQFHLISFPLLDNNLFLVSLFDTDRFSNSFSLASEPLKDLLLMLVLLSFFLLINFLIAINQYRKSLYFSGSLEKEILQRQLTEKKYRKVLEVTKEGFWMTDPETGTVVDVNNGLCNMIGLPAEEIIGCPFAEFLSNGQEIIPSHVDNLATENGCLEANLKRHADTSIPVVINSALLFDEQQQKSFICAFFTDISKQIAREEQQHLFFKAVSQSGSSIVITDNEGTIQFVNQQFSKVSGYKGGEITGQNPRILKSSEHSVDVYKKLWQTITKGETWRGRLHNRRKDGHLYWEDVTISPVTNGAGSITHFIGIKDDITSQVKLEEELRETREKFLTAYKAKNEFIANMSHEIRTPINAIIGLTELVLESPLNDQQSRFLATTLQSAKYLLHLINDILDLSKIDAEKLTLETETFDLKKFMTDIDAILSPAAEKKGLQLITRVLSKESCFVRGDRIRLQQVLLNLAGNAIKFTHQGSVDISITLQPEDDERTIVLFKIHDTGIGINKEDHQKIFNKFSQGDASVTREFGGTGLGLAICRKLVKLMDGKLWMESTPGKGSVFYFSVVLAKGREELAKTLPSHAVNEMAPSEKRTRSLDILFVEDNKGNQMLGQAILENAGHMITIAENGLEALYALSKHHFDLVFMDVQMPKMDGLTATSCIRKFEEGKKGDLVVLQSIQKQLAATLAGRHTPIIATTASAMPGDLERCLAAGTDEYIIKPYNKVQLLEIAANYGVEQNLLPAMGGKDYLVQINRHLQDTFGLNADESKSILKTYGRTLEANLVGLKVSIENKKLAETARHAHTIKGALLNLGQTKLAEIAQNMERSARAREEINYAILAQKLENILKLLRDS